MQARPFYRVLLPAVFVIAVAAAFLARTAFRKHRHDPQQISGYSGTSESWPHSDNSMREISGSISGKVVDENDRPIYLAKVTVFPLDSETGSQNPGALNEWTNKDGVFEFPRLKLGEYLVGVGIDDAPTGERPFFASYYPGAEKKQFAEPVRVQGDMKIDLRPMRLRRMQTTTIKIHLKWQNGTPVEQGNLLFHNTKFSQAVIGDTAPAISNGEGEFVVPLGFDYEARAGVWCDGGDKIDVRESDPVQHLRIDSKHIPQELTFIMRSHPCKLWSPPQPVKR
jgi:hypothetical protein